MPQQGKNFRKPASKPQRESRTGGKKKAPLIHKRKEAPAPFQKKTSRISGVNDFHKKETARKHPVIKKRPGKRTGSAPGAKERAFSSEETRNSLFPGNREVRLNKFIANAGICSRRDADILIETGAIKVNGKVVTMLGTKISPGDRVEYDGRLLSGEPLRYVLLNKPKDFITTVDDPQNRRTVMALIEHACRERIYPVGRLDRNTTGLLLFTNDGDLAKKLTHPRHRVKKVYQVELDKPLVKNDMIRIGEGVELEDGFIMPDLIAYAEAAEDKKIISIEIHSGKNRIVRRIFEKFGYEIKKLDRIVFANLTKKNLPRGKCRHLTLTEINILRRIN